MPGPAAALIPILGRVAAAVGGRAAAGGAARAAAGGAGRITAGGVAKSVAKSMVISKAVGAVTGGMGSITDVANEPLDPAYTASPMTDNYSDSRSGCFGAGCGEVS